MRRLPAEACITEAGARDWKAGFVLEGVLRVIRASPSGHRQVVGLLMPGDPFGDLFVGQATFSIESATATMLCMCDRRRFEAMLSVSPGRQHDMATTTLAELRAAREWLVVLGRFGIRARVAAFLLLLVARGCADTAPAGLQVRIPISRRDMADFLATRPETISRAIRRLARDRVLIVERGGVLTIPDPDALVAAAGGEVFVTEWSQRPGPRQGGPLIPQRVLLSPRA